MVFDEVPMDVVVDYLQTNRNAIYKLLHDARRKLKDSLEARGVGVNDSMDLFAE
jgi:RNA polymerase sigma-70 factor (ECF subfamily)